MDSPVEPEVSWRDGRSVTGRPHVGRHRPTRTHEEGVERIREIDRGSQHFEIPLASMERGTDERVHLGNDRVRYG
jgi:hypothetical protein